MTRLQTPAPATFLDARTGAPRFGTFAGPLPAVNVPSSLFARITRQKRWVYLAIATDDIWIALAIVRTGYAATAFGFAYDLRAKSMLEDCSVIGIRAHVANDAHADGSLARFHAGSSRVAFNREGSALRAYARIGTMQLDAVLDTRGCPELAVIADLGAGRWDATEKQALVPVRGEGRVGSRVVSFDGARAGWDYTHGFLPRRTKWRWAFAIGRASTGEAIALNLCAGFVGGAECAIFIDGNVFLLVEPRITFEDPLGAWLVRGRGLDLRFVPGAMHVESTNLILVRSRFLQPVGVFTGTIELGHRSVALVDVPGVVEDQDVLW